MRFVIVDGLPFLIADGKTFACRWDEKGFTVGKEVKLPYIPEVNHPEIAILAKCAGKLDSIAATEKPTATGTAKPKGRKKNDSDG